MPAAARIRMHNPSAATSGSLSQHALTAPASSRTTSKAVTVTAVTAGQQVLLAVWYEVAPGATSISGLGATWTKLLTETPAIAVGGLFEVWVGVGTTAGGTSYTITATNSTRFQIAHQIWSGLTGTVISSAGLQNQVTTTPAGPARTPTTTGQVVAGFWADNNQSSAYSSYTDTPAAWTVADDAFDASFTGMRLHSAYRVATSTASHQHIGNGGVGSNWQSGAVVLS